MRCLASTFSQSRHSGFTFLEVMMVIVIAGLMATVAVPQFFNMLERVPEAELRHLTRVINSLRNDAILGHSVYHVVFDLKEQVYKVEREMKEGGRAELQEPKIVRPHPFPENFRLELVSLTVSEPGKLGWDPTFLGTKVQEKSEITIDSSGFVTPFTLIFSQEDQFWRIQTKGILGKLKLYEGKEPQPNEDEEEEEDKK